MFFINHSLTAPDSAYSEWVHLRLQDASTLLLSLVEESSNLSIREAALVAYVKIIATDGRARRKMTTTTKKSKHFINEKAFNALVQMLLSSNHDTTPVLNR